MAKHLKKLAMLDVLILGIIVVVLSGSVYKKQGALAAAAGRSGPRVPAAGLGLGAVAVMTPVELRAWSQHVMQLC